MRAFTIDAESVALTPGEMEAFGSLVREACYPDLQHHVSVLLARIDRPQFENTAGYIAREANRSWRAESRM
jgi:hypothetical protein